MGNVAGSITGELLKRYLDGEIQIIPDSIMIVVFFLSLGYYIGHNLNYSYRFIKFDDNNTYSVATLVLLFFGGWFIIKILVFVFGLFGLFYSNGFSNVIPSSYDYLFSNHNNPLTWLIMAVVIFILFVMKIFADEILNQLDQYMRMEAQRLTNRVITKIKQHFSKDKEPNCAAPKTPNVMDEKKPISILEELSDEELKWVKKIYNSKDHIGLLKPNGTLKELRQRGIISLDFNFSSEDIGDQIHRMNMIRLTKRVYFTLSDDVINELDNYYRNLSLASDMSTP